MAAAFYSRYIPPGNGLSSTSKQPVDDSQTPQKRKRTTEGAIENSEDVTPAKKQKKNKKKSKNKDASNHVSEPSNGPSADRKDDARDIPSSKVKKKSKKGKKSKEAEDELDQYNSGQYTHGENAALRKREKTHSNGLSASNEPTEKITDQVNGVDENTSSGRNRKASKKHKAKEREDGTPLENPVPEKFAGIYAKLEKSREKASLLPDRDKVHTESDQEKDAAEQPHGLEPLPQPVLVSGPQELPSYSTLPPWLMNPFIVSSDTKKAFSELGLDSKIASTLEGDGYTQAFPIQSAVIPMLLKQDSQHSGDLCISAATGSGKTMAYALPLVSQMRYSAIARLRGLIVVPTRELVRQARDACDLIATGTGLRVGTAVGTTSLREEQSQLMRRDQIYDPVAYEEQDNQCMTAESWTNFNLQDYINEVESSERALPGHISTSSPNVDILICTPGRLVDHIRSTKGFTLADLEWLVIDEADRLLNESFQDWVEIVIPALHAKDQPQGPSEHLLQTLGYSMHKPSLRKVILSATMTRDIDKLNSLRLHNPMFVAVGIHTGQTTETGHQQQIQTDQAQGVDHGYTLPFTLSEKFVPVGDGADKPLYLFKLLLSHCGLRFDNQHSKNPRTRSHSVSSGSSSLTETSSDSSDDDDSSDSSSDVSDSSSDSSDSTNSNETPIDATPKLDKISSRSTVLVFTKSSEAASRLSRLLALIHPPLASQIGTLSKSNKSSTARKTLSAYRQGKISVIIATDRASRGLDLPSLSHVVSYDVPSSATTYVHRVGRTARAGREGCAWTLVAHREGRWFANEIAKGANSKITRDTKVEKFSVSVDSEGNSLRKTYAEALGKLEQEVTEDNRGSTKSGR